uniref:Uncharacterized protein n=1 Tax=Rhizophora mucronata TaxID=61149 RepID=A0A2P2MLZ3_RHIMU
MCFTVRWMCFHSVPLPYAIFMTKTLVRWVKFCHC